MPQALESLQREFAEALDAHAPCSGLGGKDDMQRQRIGLYCNSVRTHRRKALASAYPVLLALVGDEYFDALSVAYVRAHPSQSGDLNGFGEALPAFIDAYEPDARFRYFADLARLEWSLHAAYFAADAQVLTPQQWAAIHPDDLLDANLAVHPACELVSSRYAIADIWAAHQPGGIFPVSFESPTHALIVRPQWRAEIRVQSAAAQAAFQSLQEGAKLNDALESAFAIDANFDFISQWRVWIEAGAIIGPLYPMK